MLGAMQARHDVTVHTDVGWEMRDGTVLYCDVYRPAGDGPFPVLLVRTPYNKSFQRLVTPTQHARWFARHGYLVVIQDVRGRWSSEGDWYPFAHEEQDGYDTVEHAAALPGSSGRVGMFGGSYSGATQWLAAVAGPPHLECISPSVTASDYHDGWTYRGGALNQGFVQTWSALLAQDAARRQDRPDLETACIEAYEQFGTRFFDLPLDEFALLDHPDLAPWYFDWLRHPSRDEYWRRWSIQDRYGQITVPALHIGGWYDIFVDGTLRNYVGMREHGGSAAARTGQRLLIGPWHHSPFAELINGTCFGPAARGSVVSRAQVRWWQRWLRDDEADEGPPVELFCLGDNDWQRLPDWPPPSARTEYYLHSDGDALSLNGSGRLSTVAPAAPEEPDHFVYNPRMPVRGVGGRSCCREGSVPMGPADQRGVETGPVLVYTGDPLGDAVQVTGDISVVLHAATSARDTDWTAKLVDVHPDGRAVNIADGIIRARYRSSLAEPELLEPDRVYEYTIELGSTCARFAAGHRIRLEIASSNFPCYDRNLNTGGPFGREPIQAAVMADQTVYHDPARPSRLILPIVAA
jgi:putative CocE/NonD family hydrolase